MNTTYSPEVTKLNNENYIVKLTSSSGGTQSLGLVSKSEIKSNREGAAAKLALQMNLTSAERTGVEKFLSTVQGISKVLSRY